MATSGIPNTIALNIVNAIKAGMGWNSTQTFVSLLPVMDIGYQGQVQLQVVLGDEKPYGGGQGGQEGGELLRIQDVDLVLYYRMNLDVHGESSELLTAAGTGLNDLLEQIRTLFQFTYLGFSNGLTNSIYILFEPMWFKQKTRPVFEDEDNAIVRTTLTYSCAYSMFPFSGVNMSVTPEQINSI